MRFLYFFLMVFLLSCSTDAQKVPEQTVRLKTSNEQLQTNFDSCLQVTQGLIRSQISEKELSQYFTLGTRATGFEYDYIVQHIKDTLLELPKGYQIFYDFIFKGDTISSFRADFDSALKVVNYRKFHLTAFRQFIDGKLRISKSEATDIAVNNGMKRENISVILNCTANKFLWTCENSCNGCLSLDIDAKTGDIVRKGKNIYQY